MDYFNSVQNEYWKTAEPLSWHQMLSNFAHSWWGWAILCVAVYALAISA
jgi:hypothetical protein